MTPIIEDFEALRTRRDDLARERGRVLRLDNTDEFGAQPVPVPGHLDAFFAGHADAELPHALFDDPQKVDAHSEALPWYGHQWVSPGIELVRHPDKSWSGSVDGSPIGPYPTVSLALSAAFSLREPYRR